MTGIAAIFATGPANPAHAERMLAAMGDRVRDEAACWSQGSFALGAAVLHTTAESFEAAQPHTNEDASLALVMDGYLTNWEELRRDLTERGARLRNRSDCELVLRAYEQWGEDCAGHIEGEFAFVIADCRQQRIYAARDHQGLRPLYWYKDKNALLLASDLSAIIAMAEQQPEPNMDYLAGIIANHWSQRDATVWQGVERVPQAHWMTHSAERRVVRQYYQIPAEVTIRYPRAADYQEHYRTMLCDAVRRASRSHAPLGVAVSGGLDSSALYCIAHLLDQQGRLAAPSMQGYTLAGQEGTGAYELPYARAAAEHCGRSLIEEPLFRPGIDWFIAQGQRECDIPIPQNGAMTRYLEQRVAANGSRTWLNGEGGDQWLDGTLEYYSEFARAGDLAGFAAALRRDADSLGWGVALPDALRFGVSGLASLPMRQWIRRRRRRKTFLDPADLFWLRPEWPARLLELEERRQDSLPQEPRALGNVSRLFSPRRCYTLDIMQRQRAACGLETREPMQSRQFIEFCASTPKYLYNEGGWTKMLHRRAMRSIMPDSIVERRTKAEFSAPGLELEFARFVLANMDKYLTGLCNSEGIRRLTGPDNELRVDPEKGWAVWGSYAVAAFLLATDQRLSRADDRRDLKL